MSSFFSAFDSKVVSQLSTHLASSLNLEESDITSAVNSFTYVPTIKTASAPKKPTKPVENAKKTPSKPVKASSDNEEEEEQAEPVAKPSKKDVKKPSTPSVPSQCEYIGKKGDKAGIRCTTKVKEANDEGHFLCATHNGNKAKATKQAKESLNADVEKNTEPVKGTAKTTKSSAPKTKVGAKAVADEKTEDLVNNLLDKKPLALVKNKFNNHEDPKTKIIFDKTTKKAIGTQLKDGTIGALTDEQIAICERENYPFDVVEQKKEKKQVVKQPPPKSSKKVVKEESSSDEDDAKVSDDEASEEVKEDASDNDASEEIASVASDEISEASD